MDIAEMVKKDFSFILGSVEVENLGGLIYST